MPEFAIKKEQLNEINAKKDNVALRNLGGVSSLATVSQSHHKHGLGDDEIQEDALEARRALFGTNKLKESQPASLVTLWLKAFKDPIIIVLCAAAVLSTVLGSAIEEERENEAYIEGIAIWIAVVVVTGVGAFNEWRKDKQFQELNNQKNIIMVKAVRGGREVVISSHDVVVGDVLLIETGDKLVADGVVVDSFGLLLDEASLTGESDAIKKDVVHDPWCRSGTQVREGSGTILVLAVGESSEWGKTMELVGSAGSETTPLQDKLAKLAVLIGKVGSCVAVLCFVALLVKWVIQKRGFPLDEVNHNGPVSFLMFSVTIIVVTVPEGLPLAVTLALAYSMKKMMRDNNFVRVLAATETMGGATAICSDKTGTLTQNRMIVTEGWFAGNIIHQDSFDSLGDDLKNELSTGIALNSKAFLHEENNGEIEFIGNSTDCALLMLMRGWGFDYRTIRTEKNDDIVQMYAFSSEKKMASVLIKQKDRFRLYNKGAAEWVLQRCSQQLAEGGEVKAMSEEDRQALLKIVNDMACKSLRCICITYTDFELEDSSRPASFFDSAKNVDRNLVAVALVGIKDPVRKHVPEAVQQCQQAGIKVRMVTGDNINTARAIAKECGILDSDGLVMEGPFFREQTEEEMQQTLPKLAVLARSSPEDKLILVRALKKQGEVVAVTGDGTNDAPALKESDVGLAMGIAGTEVAKEAADIIILDDNFNSIVKTVLWGRTVLNNIRKFLQYQLTVNFAALVIVFFGAVVGDFLPLSVLQLLWINLVMNSFGAMALATEPPMDCLLQDPPNGRNSPLISSRMVKHILWQGFYQIFWAFLILFYLPVGINRYRVISHCSYYARPVCVESSMSDLGYAMEDAQRYCAYVTSCGLACNVQGPQVPECPLEPQPAPGTNARVAICGADESCAEYDNYRGVINMLEDKYETYEENEFARTRAVLFNAFLFCQVFNMINSRRIRDEYNMFEGFFTDKLFLGVLAFIVFFQAIIINFLSSIFDVTPLVWQEWLATVAIGAGVIPYSLLMRYMSRHNWFSIMRSTFLSKVWRRRNHSQPKTQDGVVAPQSKIEEGAEAQNGEIRNGIDHSNKSVKQIELGQA